MQQVLKYLSEKQQAFAESSFVGFLQDARFSPQERLGFLPCLAPFVMGSGDLVRALQGGETETFPEPPQESAHWGQYLKDLQVLGLSASTDFAGMLGLLWGSDATLTRRTLYELIHLATDASPAKRQLIGLALSTAGSVGQEALLQAVRAFEACTGKELASFQSLPSQGDQHPWARGAVEWELLPEQDARACIDA